MSTDNYRDEVLRGRLAMENEDFIKKNSLELKSAYDRFIGSARTKLGEYLKNVADDEDISSFIIPFTVSGIETGVNDPESGETATVHSLKVVEIPYSAFNKRDGTEYKADDKSFIAAINNMYLNKIVKSFEDILYNELKETKFRLYFEFGKTKTGSFTVSIISSGEKKKTREESADVGAVTEERCGFRCNTCETRNCGTDKPMPSLEMSEAVYEDISAVRKKVTDVFRGVRDTYKDDYFIVFSGKKLTTTESVTIGYMSVRETEAERARPVLNKAVSMIAEESGVLNGIRIHESRRCPKFGKAQTVFEIIGELKH
jgi:hypothetical protein